jgi:PhnB protein
MTTTTSPTTMPPVTGVTPYVQVRDATAAAELYQQAFGAEVVARLPGSDGKRLMHCHLRINGGTLFINDPFPEHGYPLEKPQSFTLHLQVDDADAWFQRAVSAGLEVVKPIEVMFWGDRYGMLRDPFGVQWSIGGPNR